MQTIIDVIVNCKLLCIIIIKDSIHPEETYFAAVTSERRTMRVAVTCGRV